MLLSPKHRAEAWPELPLEAWRDTYATLHMWMQVVGKIKLALTPLVNHWWNVPFYVTARGLGTGAMPYLLGQVQIDFDFIDHTLNIQDSLGQRRFIPLGPRPVAEFYRELMDTLAAMNIRVRIWPTPVEVSQPIPFAQDMKHHSYDAQYAQRFWRALASSARIFQEFRARFIGKCSPVHFFWGSCDLAVTRFSGRPAPPRPEADRITREAYSHEVISHGFWPGGSWFGTEVPGPVYYAYAVPEPPGMRPVPPAIYHPQLHEFVLDYQIVRQADSPRDMLLEFLQNSYESAANSAGWNRPALERT